MKLVRTPQEFISTRTFGQYIGVNIRPDVCAPIQLLAPGRDAPTPANMMTLNKVTAFLMETSDIGLDFVSLDMDSGRVVLLYDASFGNARDDKSQLGYLLLMVDKHKNCNIVHYGSNRCR